MEAGNGSPVSSLRMEVVGQPQGYLALRVWVKSALPLHRRSRRCRPPNQFSVSSLQALKEQECKQRGEGGEGGGVREGRVDMEREGERERETSTENNSSMFVHVQHFKTFWEKQVVNGLKTFSEGRVGGQPFGKGRWLAGPTVFWTVNREDGRHRGTSRAPPIRIRHRPREP